MTYLPQLDSDLQVLDLPMSQVYVHEGGCNII